MGSKGRLSAISGLKLCVAMLFLGLTERISFAHARPHSRKTRSSGDVFDGTPWGLRTTQNPLVRDSPEFNVRKFLTDYVISHLDPMHSDLGPCPSDDQNSESEPSDQDWHFCFQDKCRCRGQLADCFNSDLCYIPPFPGHVTELDFSFNNCDPMIISPNFFINVTGIVSLDLSSNIIGTFSSESLLVLKNLSRFIFSLHSNFLPAVYAAQTLQELRIKSVDPWEVPDLRPLSLLQRLNLDGNDFNGYNLTSFAHLDFPKALSLKQTGITAVTNEILRFEALYLSSNFINDFPPTCFNGASYFPQLLILDLSDNKISYIPESVCLPSLECLYLSQNLIHHFATNSFASWKFPSLLELVLGVDSDDQMDEYAFNNSGLLYLSLTRDIDSFRGINFDRSKDVDPGCFKGCTNLSTIVLNGNNFEDVTPQTFQQLFDGLPKLQRLDLRSCYIKNITNETFYGLSSLRALNLSDNFRIDLQEGAFSSLSSLTELDLSQNRMMVIPETSFSRELRDRLTWVDFRGNKLICNCSMLWFHKWFVKDRAKFSGSTDSYDCVNDCDNNMLTFVISDQACMFPKEVYVAMFAWSLTAVFVLLLTLACLRWRLRARARRLLREVIRMQRQRRPVLANDNNRQLFQYDIFVSYAEDDSAWIDNHLKPEVEGRWGLKLCLHHRDFHPGRRILENIEACVETSRKMLFVFSPHFANSQWCQFELSLGLTYTMDRNEELLVVYLSEIPPEDLTRGMSAILRSCTYLRWPDRDLDDDDRFWAGLRDALPHFNGRRNV